MGAAEQPLRFQGQYADEETGLYYNQARYYASELGRYLSRDPLEFAAGPNPYLYCYNDPLGGRDPTGLLSGFWKAAVAVGAIAVGVAVLVVAFPAVITAVGALAVGTAIINAGAVVVAGGLVGAGVGLALAPDGCVECQRRMAWDMAVAGAGAALTAMSMVIFPPLAGGMALAGGGVVGAGAALAMAGAGVLVGTSVMNTGLQQAMKDNEESGGSSKDNSAGAEKERQAALREKSAQGDKNATRELNEIKANKAKETGGDSRGPRAENKVLDEDGDKITEAGREVSYTDPKTGQTISSEIDNETATHVNQVKAGKSMPDPNQTQVTRMRAQEAGKTPAVQYDPKTMPRGAVKEFARKNPDFELVPRDLSID